MMHINNGCWIYTATLHYTIIPILGIVSVGCIMGKDIKI